MNKPIDPWPDESLPHENDLLIYIIRILDGEVASDASTRFQRLLAQVLENSFAGESQTAITVVLEFVRIGAIDGASRKAHPCDVLALERREPGSVGDPMGPIPGAATRRAGVSGVAVNQHRRV